jgi:hypothetical protein
MFLVFPIKECGLLKEHIIGFKEAVTSIQLIKKGKDIDNKQIVWEVNKKAIDMLPEDVIINYVNISNDEMKHIIEEAKNMAKEISETRIKKRIK